MTASDLGILAEAVTRFLTDQPRQKSSELQPELQKFVRWAGRDRRLQDLTPRHIESYCEAYGPAPAARLASLRKFLKYAQQQGLTQQELASHVKAKKVPSRPKQVRANASAPMAQLTQEGFERSRAELEELKRQRVQTAEEIRRAAADKDFRENAPLDAAREKQAHLEARIREIEQTLRYAEVVENGRPMGAPREARTRLGSRVVVKDMTIDEELAYTLVGPTEVNLRQSKISVESPAGRAFLNRSVGEIVTVEAPAGTLRYRIERIES